MQQYGLFEFRARTPKGPGVMSALWLSPALAYEKLITDGGKRQSPSEPIDIDIFNHVGNRPNSAEFAAHFGRTLGDQADRKRVDLPFDPADDFHTYALEWTEHALIWTVDGKEMNRSDKVPHMPMFLRLSLFEDPNGAYGPVNPDTAYPRDLVVDYVRVYERPSEAQAAKP
jgi:beta-glucanase (GH16 family)